MLRASLVFAVLLFGVGLPAAADSADSALPASLLEWAPGLELLHSSRTNQALEWFERRRDERPDDPCGSYFAALIYTSFDVDGLLKQRENELGVELLERGIETAQRRLQRQPGDDAARYCLGALHGLRAAERLDRGKYVSAAFDAKRARRIMLDLLDDRPNCIDCQFWVGSYDYFADVLPGVIRFFRSLLFFPKGDRERGLRTLIDVSRRGTLDRYNALWVLHSVYGRLEKNPKLAMETTQRAREAYPDSVDAYMALGWYHAARTRPPERARGIELHLEALERIVRREDASRERAGARVRLSLARLYLNDLQPGAAVRLLRPTLDATRSRVDRDLHSVLLTARALNHSGRHAEALVLLEGLRLRHAGLEPLESIERTVLAFDADASRSFHEIAKVWRAGRMGAAASAPAAFDTLRDAGHDAGLIQFGEASLYFELERYTLAERHYRAAAEAGIERPTMLLPLTYIRLGNLLDLQQKRREAKIYYRKASSAAGAHESLRSLAKRYLKEPFDGTGDLRYP